MAWYQMAWYQWLLAAILVAHLLAGFLAWGWLRHLLKQKYPHAFKEEDPMDDIVAFFTVMLFGFVSLWKLWWIAQHDWVDVQPLYRWTLW